MKYEYKTNVDNYIDFQLYYSQIGVSWKRARKITVLYLILLTLLVGWGIFCSYRLHGSISHSLDMIFILLLGYYILVSHFIFNKRYLTRRTLRFYEKDEDLYPLSDYTTVELKEDSLVFEDYRSGVLALHTSFHHGSIIRVGESDKNIFVHTSTAGAEIIPKSIFTTNEEMQTFLRGVRSI